MLTQGESFDYGKQALSHLNADSLKEFAIKPIIVHLKEIRGSLGKFNDFSEAEVEQLRNEKLTLRYSDVVEQWVAVPANRYGDDYLKDISVDVRLSSGKVLELANEYIDDLDSSQLEEKLIKLFIPKLRSKINKFIQLSMSDDNNSAYKLVEKMTFKQWADNILGQVDFDAIFYREQLGLFYNSQLLAQAGQGLIEYFDSTADLQSESKDSLLNLVFGSNLSRTFNIQEAIYLIALNKFANTRNKRIVVSGNHIGPSYWSSYRFFKVEDITDDSRPVIDFNTKDIDSDSITDLQQVGRTLLDYGLSDEFAIRQEDGVFSIFAQNGINAWDELYASFQKQNPLVLNSLRDALEKDERWLSESKAFYNQVLELAKNS